MLKGEAQSKIFPLEGFYDVLLCQEEYETWNVGMWPQECSVFTHWMFNSYSSQFPELPGIRILLGSSFPLSIHNFDSSQTEPKRCYRALSYKIRVLFCTSGENSIPLMFFWMLIPATPLSSRSICSLLVINSFDSYK